MIVIRLFKIEGSTLVTGRKNLAAKAIAGILASGPEPFAKFDLGPYVKSYNPDAHDGRGEAFFTNRIKMAKKFNSIDEAMEFWNQTSKVRPIRPDGKPNRPLTAYNITFETVKE